MGTVRIQPLEKKQFKMNFQFFALLLLLVLAVNGAPKANPKSEMTILLPGYGMAFDSHGNDISGNSGFGNNGGFGNFRGRHGGAGPKPELNIGHTGYHLGDNHWDIGGHIGG